jgi:response regulator of citrate/malate metabolism
MSPIRVLLVEGEPVAVSALAVYVGRVPGFNVLGQAATGADALRLLPHTAVDVVLLDICLPDMNGLEVVRAMRAAGHQADVIAVTRARAVEVVQAAVTYGIVQYLVKPFTFAMLRSKLERYAAYREKLAASDAVVAQHEVDRLLSELHRAGRADLPKGMSRESLDAVVAVLKSSTGDSGMSAAEVAEVLGASRVTARRYLEYIAEAGLAVRQARYHSAGRPEVEYRWRSPRTALSSVRRPRAGGDRGDAANSWVHTGSSHADPRVPSLLASSGSGRDISASVGARVR